MRGNTHVKCRYISLSLSANSPHSSAGQHVGFASSHSTTLLTAWHQSGYGPEPSFQICSQCCRPGRRTASWRDVCHLLRHPEDTAPAAGGPLAAAAHCTRCEGRAEGGRFGRLPLARSRPAEGFAVPSLGVPGASCPGEGRHSHQGAGKTGGADAPSATAPHAVQHPAAQFADAAAHSPLWLPRQGGGSRDPGQIPSTGGVPSPLPIPQPPRPPGSRGARCPHRPQGTRRLAAREVVCSDPSWHPSVSPPPWPCLPAFRPSVCLPAPPPPSPSQPSLCLRSPASSCLPEHLLLCPSSPAPSLPVSHPSAPFSLSSFLFHLPLHPSDCRSVPADSGECLLVCASLCYSGLILCSLSLFTGESLSLFNPSLCPSLTPTPPRTYTLFALSVHPVSMMVGWGFFWCCPPCHPRVGTGEIEANVSEPERFMWMGLGWRAVPSVSWHLAGRQPDIS